MQPGRRDCIGPVPFRAPTAPPIGRSAAGDRRTECFRGKTSDARLAVGLAASFALLPLAWAQGAATRRRVARLPSASPPHRGEVPGLGAPIRVLAIGESSISGVGVSCSAQSMTAVAARTLARRTGRPASWRVHGFSGATARQAMKQLMPRIAREPADLVIIAFGVNDATSYRSPKRVCRRPRSARGRRAATGRRGGGGHRGRCSAHVLSGPPLAASRHPRLALSRIAGGGRSARGQAAQTRRGAICGPARAGDVRPGRLPPKSSGACAVG